MGRFWTSYWRFRNWRPDINSEGKPLRRSAGDSFRKRGISIGDTVYVISLNEGQLYLGGRLVVKRIISRREAVKLFDNRNLYDAKEWVVALERSGTPLHLHRRLSPKLTKRLRFETKSGPKEPFFVSDTHLDNQATRGVRELTAESAALLDRIIDRTDQLPTTGKLVTVTESMLRETHNTLEFSAAPTTPKGDLQAPPPERLAITTYRIIRDTELARSVKALHGYKCQICGHRIVLPDGSSYAEGHHLQPLGEPHNGPDIIANILCVCPNHHAELDLGARNIALSNLAIADGHAIARRFVDYHNKKVYRRV